MTRNYIRFTAWITKAQKAALKKKAKLVGVSASDVLRDALQEFLNVK